jgi:hypothetical protein
MKAAQLSQLEGPKGVFRVNETECHYNVDLAKRDGQHQEQRKLFLKLLQLKGLLVEIDQIDN